MAWIESHQELAHHPKVARLSYMLDVHPARAVGHLHMFWWWCLSYADDGDVTDFSPFELAHGAQWDGEPDVFVKALRECGWLDDVDGRTEVHDWWDYAGKLVERRRADAERKRQARSEKSKTRPTDVRKDGVRTQPNQPNPTNSSAPNFEVFHMRRLLRIARQRGADNPDSYARTLIADPEHVQESEHRWAHRNCEQCDFGYTSTYTGGAGNVEIRCEATP